MSTTTITTTPNMPVTGMQSIFPPVPAMPLISPNDAQMKAISELAQMFQNGQNPLEELRQLREKVSGLEKQLSEKSAQEIGTLEKQLLDTPKGAMYLDIRRDGILEILTRHALRNPDTAEETKSFLEGWQNKASEYLKIVNAEEKG